MGNDAYDAGRTITTVGAYAGAGAMIGSVVPGVGTAVGAVGGAVVGGLVSLFGGGPEAQNHEANIGGRSIDARKIWEQIHPGSSSSLNEGAGAAQDLKGVHDQRAQQIDAINKAMDAAWQGDASAQVQAGAHPLGTWLQDSATNLQKSHTYLTNQGESFDSAKGKVEEVASKPPEAGFMDGINPFSDKDDEINEYNKKGQANVDAFNAYYQASATNAAQMPQYSAWQGNTFSDGDGTGTGTPGTGGGGGGNVPSTGGGGGGVGNLPKFDTNMPSTDLPGTGGNDKYGTNTPKYDTNTPSTTTPGYQSPSWDSTRAAGYTPSSSDFSNGFGPGGSSPGFGQGGGSGSGSGAGAGGFGGGIGGGFGPAGAGSLGAGASTGAGGAGSGAGAGIRGGAAGMGSGAAGRGGASGMGGMGAGAGRGKGGDDDEEHENKYLIGEDPNELFGTDELTAPPVIGE